jgi:peptidoglycan hydrolase-like protein with peptidoglycan-binding domain
VTKRWVILGVAGGIAVVAAVLLYGSYAAQQDIDKATSISNRTAAAEPSSAGWAEENVSEVQMKLRESGLYFGEIDGAYSSELAAALGRYQIRNGLPITGQLDVETSKALGVRSAVATSAASREQSSQVWQRLRRGDEERFAKNNAEVAPSPGAAETSASGAQMGPRSVPAATAPISSGKPASAPPATGASSPSPDISTDRLRDYVGAFVLAGLDLQVGAEAAFFADRVQYYNEGVLKREKIRKDLQRYATRWPQRRFWLDGDVTVEPQNGNRVQVTFPLRYELRNRAKHSSGKINKTLVLEPAGDDLQIVAVNERKAE